MLTSNFLVPKLQLTLNETNTLEINLREFHQGMKYLAFKDDLNIF